MSYLVEQKNGRGQVYVHQVQSHWDKKKQQSVQTRVYLGRKDEATGRIVPGRCRSGASGAAGITVAEAKRLAAEGADVRKALSAPAASPASFVEVTAVMDPGCLHLFRSLASDTGLSATLEKIFGVQLAGMLLRLAFHQACEGNPLYLAVPWLERVLGGAAGVSSGGAGHLLAEIGLDEQARMRFFEAWLERRGRPTALVYDVTSVSTYSETLELAEFGYNRDGEPLRQVNLASVNELKGGLPLFYRALPGSVVDVATLKLTCELVRELGIPGWRMVLDRGFCSQANVRWMLEENVGFTMAIPLTSQAARGFVNQRRSALVRAKHAFPWQGHPMHHLSDAWPVELSDGRQCGCVAHLYYDPKRKAEGEDRLLARVLLIEERAATATFHFRRDACEWIAANAHGLREYLSVRYRDGTFHVQRKNNAIARRANQLGITLILTTDLTLTREETLGEYRSRDGIEKAYDILKNENGMNRLRISTREQAEGRLFLAFLALILSCELDRRMKKAGLYKKYTTAEVLAELAKIRALRLPAGACRLLELTKLQRGLFDNLGVAPLTSDLVTKG